MARRHAAAAPDAERRRAAPRMAGAGRHRRPVPGHPAAQAGLAAGHARLRSTTRRVEALADARKDVRSRVGGARPRPGRRRRARRATGSARDEWVETVLRDVVGWAESLPWGAGRRRRRRSRRTARSPSRAQARCSRRRRHRCAGASSSIRSTRCAQTPNDLWAATPIDRMEALLRDNDVADRHRHRRPLVGAGLRPRGHDGRLRHRRRADLDRGAAHPRRVPRRCIGRQYIIGGDPAERLPVLFEESVAAAEEITEALGAQVRRAVELLVQSFSESAADARRRGQPDPLPDRHARQSTRPRSP